MWPCLCTVWWPSCLPLSPPPLDCPSTLCTLVFLFALSLRDKAELSLRHNGLILHPLLFCLVGWNFTHQIFLSSGGWFFVHNILGLTQSPILLSWLVACGFCFGSEESTHDVEGWCFRLILVLFFKACRSDLSTVPMPRSMLRTGEHNLVATDKQSQPGQHELRHSAIVSQLIVQ